MDIGFLITTYNRQESCQRLVDSLQGLGDILVLNDGSDYEINGCRQVFQEHMGRVGYFSTVNNLFSLRGRHRYYIMLPDDFLMDKEQVDRAVELWQAISDKKKICLNLFADRIGLPCWTRFKPVLKGNLWLTQWVDMCFLCEEWFFKVVGNIDHRQFHGNLNKRSSGVGAYISKRLYANKYNLYQVRESLVTPQESHNVSQMQNNDNRPYCNYPFPRRKFETLH